MEIFILFLLFTKHLLADFIWQYPRHYLTKGDYGKWGGIEHALFHSMGSVVVGFITFLTALYLGCLNLTFWMMALLILPLIDGIIHYHMDWFKMYWCKRKGYTMTNGKENGDAWFHWLGFDQYVHYLTYLGIAWILGALLK